jgi:hypothetical protein
MESIQNITFHDIHQINPSKEDKDYYGEIYTPFNLIDEMFSSLPSHVFLDPSFVWLDPAAGPGYFSIVLFKRLFCSLKNVIPDDDERESHILNNMIYQVEINDKHLPSLEKYFPRSNIIIGDFLKETLPFQPTIIVGNPPYNFNGAKKTPTNTILSKSTEGKTIWYDFIRKSVSILSSREEGYFLMITPLLWLRWDRAKIHQLLFNSKTVDVLKIKAYSNTETNSIFKGNAQTPTCYFSCIISNNISRNAHEHLNNNTNPSTVIELYDKVKRQYVPYPVFKPVNSIPVSGASIMSKIVITHRVRNIPSMSNIVIKSSTPPRSTVFTDHSEFVNIQTCLLDGLEPYLSFNYTTTCQKYKGVSKLVMAHKMYGFPYLDLSGEYGICTRDNYILVDTPDILKFNYCLLSTPWTRFIFNSTRYRMKYLEKQAFEFIPDLRNENIFKRYTPKWDIERMSREIYKFYEFTQDEILRIERSTRPYHTFYQN